MDLSELFEWYRQKSKQKRKVVKEVQVYYAYIEVCKGTWDEVIEAIKKSPYNHEIVVKAIYDNYDKTYYFQLGF